MSENTEDPSIAGLMQEFGLSRTPASGTRDDDDDRDDEHSGENEAAVREHDENTEAPDEFGVDDEDEDEDEDEVEDEGNDPDEVPAE
jgi:hypothetical protein